MNVFLKGNFDGLNVLMRDNEGAGVFKLLVRSKKCIFVLQGGNYGGFSGSYWNLYNK